MSGVGVLKADPAVNRALDESRKEIEQLKSEFQGEELRNQIKKLPLLKSDELRTLNSHQQLKLRDKRLEYWMQVYAEIDAAEAKEEISERVPTQENSERPEVIEVTDSAEQIDVQELSRQVNERLKGGSGSQLDKNFMSNLMDTKMKAQLSEMMKNNPLASLPREEIESRLELSFEGKPLGKMMKKYPKLKTLFVETARDEKALPSLISIVNKPEEMKHYGITVAVIFLVAFILNLLNSKGNLLKRIGKKLALGIGSFLCNIGAFYFFFHQEIDPTLNVVKRVFF